MTTIIDTVVTEIETLLERYAHIAHTDAQTVLNEVSNHILAGATQADADAKAAILAYSTTLGAALDANKKIAANTATAAKMAAIPEKPAAPAAAPAAPAAAMPQPILAPAPAPAAAPVHAAPVVDPTGPSGHAV